MVLIQYPRMIVILGERPNTYTYTKAIAEHLIAEEAAREEDPAKRIPMAIG